MKLMKSIIWGMVVAGLLSVRPALAGACEGESTPARFFPRVLGRPHASIRTPYQMPCDTMEVRIGDTCTVYPGVMVHFGPQSTKEKVILIRGRLEVLGSEDAPVYFSGTLADGDFGLKPGTGDWGGFRIDPAGEAEFSNTRIFKAMPALLSKSERVRFSKVVFKQSLDFKGPNGKGLTLEFKETKIETMDFGTGPAPERISLAGNDAAKADPTIGGAKHPGSPMTWTLLGGGTILAGAGLFWFLTEAGETGPSPGGIEFPDRPTFPKSKAP